MKVLAHGVFDLFHPGHVEYLRQAAAFGDYLIVSVVADAYVSKPRPLIYIEAQRMFMVASQACVDAVVLCQAPGPENILRARRPDIYARNDEYLAGDKPEYAICRELGIKTIFTVTKPPHTTDLIARIKSL